MKGRAATGQRQAKQTAASAAVDERGRLALSVAGLFERDAARLTEEHVAVFDNALSILVAQSDEAAKIELARRLAALENAPLGVLEKLARDESSDVAAPILTTSTRLSDDTLIDLAAGAGQGHLLAIAGRQTVSEPVTDVIVDRGAPVVLRRLATNEGARFSSDGMAHLVTRARGDDALAIAVGARVDLPRKLGLKLFATASTHARAQLHDVGRRTSDDRKTTEAAAPVKVVDVHDPSAYATALAEVGALHRSGSLRDVQVRVFAERALERHLVAAFVHLTELPLHVAERALRQDGIDDLLVMARAGGLSFETLSAIMAMRAGEKGVTPHALRQAATHFDRLKPETALKALQLLRRRRSGARRPG